MKRKTWPLVLGVVVVGALAGLALGGRPTTLPTVQIPPSTVSTLVSNGTTGGPATSVAPVTTKAPATTAPSVTAGS